MKLDRWVISGGLIHKAPYGAWVLLSDVRELFSSTQEHRHPECVADGCRLKEHTGYTTCERSGECDMMTAERVAEHIHKTSGVCLKVDVLARAIKAAR